MGDELDDISLQREKIRHKQILDGQKAITNALSSIQKDDPELKKLISENRDAINNFVEAVKGLGKQEKPEVKVETNQDKVVAALTGFSEQIGEIMKDIDKRLSVLESQPKPKELKVTGYDYHGRINKITIDYNK